MTTYNGYKNWDHWNVAKWIEEDIDLYTMAQDSVIQNSNRPDAVLDMMERLNEAGLKKTPDGARYTKSAVKSALRQL